jgi:phage pi2 protein 07
METAEGGIAGESMKVAIVSTPRTCSSFLGTIFADKFNLIDYSEIFSETWVKTDVHTKLKIITRSDNYTAKITSTSLTSYPGLFDYKSFPWDIFDYIILAERFDIVQQAASWLLLSQAHQIGKGDQDTLVEYLSDGMTHPEDFPDVNENELEHILGNINHFTDFVKPHLLNSGLTSVKLVNHEMFQRPKDEYITELREKTDIYWRINDIKREDGKTSIDYTPYIEAKKLQDVIQKIQNKLKGTHATKEETYERTDSTEVQGIV